MPRSGMINASCTVDFLATQLRSRGSTSGGAAVLVLMLRYFQVDRVTWIEPARLAASALTYSGRIAKHRRPMSENVWLHHHRRQTAVLVARLVVLVMIAFRLS